MKIKIPPGDAPVSDTMGPMGIPRPQYNAAYDPEKMGGLIKDLDPNVQSPWVRMATYQAKLKDAANREKLGRQVDAETGQSMSRLAASGGLSSGARERAVNEGSKNFLAMNQDIGRASDSNILGMQADDAKQRQSAWASAKDMDVKRQLEDNQRKNDYTMSMYEADLQAEAAKRQAKATRKSGGK